MTRAERVSLSDAISAVYISIERADYLLQTMLDEYFGKYNPEEASFWIRSKFPKLRAFAYLLKDQLAAIEDLLPTVEWVDKLKCEEARQND